MRLFCSMTSIEENHRAANSQNPPKPAFIFDMDGTLIASTRADYLAWKKVFEQEGRDLSFQDYEPLLGMKSSVVVSEKLGLSGEAFDKAMTDKIRFFEEVVKRDGIEVYEGVYRFLEEIKSAGFKCALATSSRRPKTEMLLDSLNLKKYFEVVVTGDMIEHSKPAPDIYLFAAEKLNARPSECVVLEDAVAGVAAAKAAGMCCIAISNTHLPGQLQGADVVAESFLELNAAELAEKFCGLRG